MDTPCLNDGCKKIAAKKGRCLQHQLPAFQSRRKERLPDNWNDIRRIILRRDSRLCEVHDKLEPICYVCGGCGADTVDHVQAGDNHELSNLRAIHQNIEPHCHRKKTAAEGNAAQGNKVKEAFTKKTEIEVIRWSF